MKLRWRWSLVVILAAVVLGGLLPQALLAGAGTPASMAATSPAAPPTVPSGCADASCNKGSPAVPTPTLAIAGMVATAGVIATFVALHTSRRNRSRAHALPRGTITTLFRPPQFA